MRTPQKTTAGQVIEPPPIEPLLVTIAVAVAITGLAKTRIQQEIGAGRLHTKRAGKRTMITYPSLVSFVEALPNGAGTCAANTARGAKNAA